jgi:hypothetical protein
VYTPVLPYSTALDQFLLLCFVHVVAQSCVHGVMFYAREREKLKEEQEEQEKEEAAMNESDDDEDDEEEGEEAIAVKPYAQKAVHAIAIQQGNGRNNASHSSSPNEQAATEMVVVAPNDAARKSHSVNAVAPAPHETDAFPASPSVAQHDHHHHAHGGVSARSRHGTVPPLEAAEGEKPKKMNKRDRKRLRKKQAMAATNAARQEAIQRVQITNSFNPVRMWWASLGLTTIRKWDVFWFVFFTASFIVATAVIFGVADTH